MKFRKSVAIILLAGMILAVAAVSCMGAALPYSSSRRQVNVGVITLSYAGGGLRHTLVSPYVFAVMDFRSDSKPRGWEFVNPLAPRMVTEQLQVQWNLLPEAVGAPVTKDCAAYWVVDLTSASSENLAQFDVLYFSTNNDTGPVTLTRDERDKLRRYVDGGGLLWIDYCSGMRFDPVEGMFIQGFNFIDAGGTPWIPYEQLSHPLMSVPFRLSGLEITRVGRLFPATSGINPGFDEDPFDLVSYNPTILLPIVNLNDAGRQIPYIVGNEFGSGHIVATAGWVGGNISEAVAGGATPSVLDSQNSNLFMASPASLKLAYNIVNWAGAYPGFRKNARHTAYSLENLNPALIKKWHFPVIPPEGVECAPATFKNCFYYVGVADGRATLFCLDGAPEQDWDGDGDANDGAKVEDPGDDFDIIWAAPLGGQKASSPIVFSMQHPKDTTKTVDVVAVVDSDSNLWLFEALPMSNGVLLPTPNAIGDPITVGGGTGSTVHAPTYHNGWLYIATDNGQVYAMNPFLALIGETGSTAQYTIHDLTPPSDGMKSSPVVGIVKNKDRGADVTMVYTLAPPIPGTGVNPVSTNDRLYGFPVFVSGERLQLSKGGTTAEFSTMYGPPRATKIQEKFPAPIVWAKDLNGNDISLVPLNSETINQPFAGQLKITRADGLEIDNNLRVYATYALDYEEIGVNVVDPRVTYPLPPTEVNSLLTDVPMVRAESSLAFGANGMLYAGLSREARSSAYPPCGSVYAMLHDTGNTPKLKWAYHLHGGDPLGTYIPQGYLPDGFVIDRDGNPDTFDPMLKPTAYDVVGGSKVEIQGLQCKSSPAVTPDKVFVTATSDTATGTARGALLCFKANSDFVIRLNESLIDKTTGKKASVRIWQPDPAMMASTRSPLEDAVTVPQEMIDYNTGTISISDFSNGALRTRSGSVPNQSTNVFTSALPVWVFVDQALVPPSQVDLSSWNNLLWFFVPKHEGGDCSGIHSSPVVLGDQVYFTCKDGFIFAIDIENGKKNGEAVGIDEKCVRWKSKVTDSKSSVLASSVGGANRLLGVVMGDGLYVYENPTTLIADNKRVLQVDGSANITWACDSTSEMFDSPIAGNDNLLRRKQPLNRPALARNFGPSDFLVVDAGNNQVIRMDKGGFISDKVSRFYVPEEHEVRRLLPGGGWSSSYTLLLSGESDSLRGPLDALLWVNQEKWVDPSDTTNTPITVNVAHWLIADTGNFRIVDIVQRFTDKGPIYSPGNTERLPELNWVTRTDVSQKTFAFNSLQLVPLSLTEEEIWVAVGNYSGASGQVGGSIMRIPYRMRPNGSDPFLLQYSNGHAATTVLTSIDGLPVANPRYVRRITGTMNHLLICDDRGVFEVVEPTGGSTDGTSVWNIVNSGPGKLYSSLPREVMDKDKGPVTTGTVSVPLRAMKAQKLPNGNVLVTNSYSGWATYNCPTQYSNEAGFRFTGEVFEVKFDGIIPTEIEWYAPMIKIESVETAALPIREIKDCMQKFDQSSPLEQPMSAERILW